MIIKMKRSNIEYFRCPRCYSSFKMREPFHDDIEEGEIYCDSCNLTVPVRNGIPRFVYQQNYADSFGFQWNKHRKTQIDKFNGYDFSKQRFFQVTGWSEDLRGQVVLEAGCGAGRFTQIACETGAKVFSFDYSNAVDANRENSGEYKNLLLFQADIYNIPLKRELFDKIFCLGVLQHTPDSRKAFLRLIPYLKIGGEIVIDIYAIKSIFSWVHWKYLLRPVTKRISPTALYSVVEKMVPLVLPISAVFKRLGDKVGARISPIANYDHLDISPDLNREWTILDTFDWYAPEHDHPQKRSAVKRWFSNGRLDNIGISYGPNGINAKGVKQ